LEDVSKELKHGDVVIKGANALGPDGIPAILIGRQNPMTTAGTIGAFQMTAMARGVEVIVPVGLEKCIPVSVLIGPKEVSSDIVDFATGMPCGLIPMYGTVVTEVEALRHLADVDTIPIAAGGIGGAEGSVTLLVKGSDLNVQKAIDVVKKIMGEPCTEEPLQTTR